MLMDLQRNMQELRRENTEIIQALEGLQNRMEEMQETINGLENREQECREADAERDKRIYTAKDTSNKTKRQTTVWKNIKRTV